MDVRIIAALVLGLGCLGSLAQAARAQASRIAVSVDSVTVGERFLATVAVEVEAGSEVIFPSLAGGPFSSGDAEFIRPVKVWANQDRTVARYDSATYEVAVFGIDSAMVGGLPVGIVTPYGDTLVGASPSVLVGIHSVVPEDAAGIKDLAPLATFPPALWPWILGGLAVLAAIAVAYYLWNRARNRKLGDLAAADVRVDPYDEAVNRLRGLAEHQPVTDAEIRQYYIDVSDTLRTYLEYSISVPALERTSAELMTALKRLSAVSSGLLADETLGHIGRTLTVSDLAKFASHRPKSAENGEILDLARESVESIERARRRRLLESQAQEAQVA